jgi:hypothetical protein
MEERVQNTGPQVDPVRVRGHPGERLQGSYTEDQAEALLPRLTALIPPDTGKPRHARTIHTIEPWLRVAIDELLALRDAVGVSRNVTVAEPPGRFEELRASGLVNPAVIDGYSRAMAAPRTPKQLLDAIGASKEITEATLRAALERLGVGWDKKVTNQGRIVYQELKSPPPESPPVGFQPN